MTSLEKYKSLDFEQANSFDDMLNQMKAADLDFVVAVFWMEIQAGERFEGTADNNVIAECPMHGDVWHFPVSDAGGLRCRQCLMELLYTMQLYYDHPELLTPEKDARLVERIMYFGSKFVN